MTNLILAIAIIVVSFGAMWGTPSRGRLFAGLAVIGAILLFVAASSAIASDFGPALGVGAFVGTFALFFVFRKSGNPKK